MRGALSVAALCALAACGPSTGKGPDPFDMGVLAPTRDNDGDGFSYKQGDCDDRNPSIYPGAPELCDNKDHNCNGIYDDICDDDHDGYAVVGSGQLPGGDCDDRDPLVNPGA